MSDGCRIAARIWLPAGAEAAPAPAILEYIPYRKRDFMRARDEPIHRYFAQNGYAAVRVDLRGSGDSDGVLLDEYTQQELDDALEIIAWIAAQPWCSGAVGMMGISWGGFNALQVAALDPPALKAIITLCSTDDRYADDAHYMGGCLLNENLQWGAILMTYCAYPPDPHIVGERWRAMWRERLDHLVPFPALWLQHQWRDGFWKHGSVCEDYGAIKCAVYAIGGWADGYSNAVPRLMHGLSCPRKGLIGPWAHRFPHNGVPGPRDRLPPGGGALVGPLAEGHRHRDHGRAAAAGVDAGERRSATLPRRAAGALGRRAHVAVAAHREASVLSQPGPARPGGRAAGHARVLVAADHRPARRRMVRVRRRRRDAARSAPGRRPLAHVRHRAARRAHRDPGRPGRSSSISRSTSRTPCSRCA